MGLLKGVARISAAAVKQLEGRAEPDQAVTEADVQEPPKLARLLTSILKDIATRKRRHYPRRIDFENLVCTSNNKLTLRHAFGGRVRWWVVEWTSSGTPLVDSGGDTLVIKSPMIHQTAASTADVLILQCDVAGTATIRVEEAG